jgi:hypothetical protein
VTVNNEAGALFPGAFANVHFDVPLAAANLRLPASALIFDHSGLRVARASSSQRSHRAVTTPRELRNDVPDHLREARTGGANET